MKDNRLLTSIAIAGILNYTPGGFAHTESLNIPYISKEELSIVQIEYSLADKTQRLYHGIPPLNPQSEDNHQISIQPSIQLPTMLSPLRNIAQSRHYQFPYKGRSRKIGNSDFSSIRNIGGQRASR